MSFNVNVRLERPIDSEPLRIFLAPELVVTGSFRLSTPNELKAFVEMVAKSAVIFSGKVTEAELQELIALGESSPIQAAEATR